MLVTRFQSVSDSDTGFILGRYLATLRKIFDFWIFVSTCKNNFKLEQIETLTDIVEKDLYFEMVGGLEVLIPLGCFYRCNKSLYGLRQAAHSWKGAMMKEIQRMQVSNIEHPPKIKLLLKTEQSSLNIFARTCWVAIWWWKYLRTINTINLRVSSNWAIDRWNLIGTLVVSCIDRNGNLSLSSPLHKFHNVLRIGYHRTIFRREDRSTLQ